MPIIQETKPFKNREDVKAEIHNCDLFGGICQYASIIFAALGIVGDVLSVTATLQPQTFFSEHAKGSLVTFVGPYNCAF